ncbi:hypothetical protein JNW90_32580 [Micromonospora sp. STR1s_5]|nr:hypothetical protein [Micromonospora sp. STR1s_5]
MTDREVRQWAERVVELYASRVKMTLLEQGELERDLAQRFKEALQLGKRVAEWVDGSGSRPPRRHAWPTGARRVS